MTTSPSPLRMLYLLGIIALLLGCGKDNNPPAPPTQTNLLLKVSSGNNQEGTFSETLPQQVSITLLPEAGKKVLDYVLDYSLIDGNGSVSHASNLGGFPIQTNATGEFILNWTLGCDRPDQRIRLHLYRATDYHSGRQGQDFILESIDISATGKKSTATWARACGLDLPQAHLAKVFSHDGKTLYLADRKLYSSTDGGQSWSLVKGTPTWTELGGAAFNSQGWMYVFTRNEGVFVSKDMKTWETINNGLLDHRDPTGYYVSDDLLMVSYYFDGPYISTDNGKFWKKLLVSTSSQRYYHFQRHPNGDLYLVDDWGAFYRSSDLGKTWQKLTISYTYVSYEVRDFAIGKDGQLYIGSGDATIAKLSPQTLQGTSKRYYEWNSSSQFVSHIRFHNDDVYYLVRHAPQAGLYSVNNYWAKHSLNFSKTINAYFIKPNGDFMLLANDGLYYRNK